MFSWVTFQDIVKWTGAKPSGAPGVNPKITSVCTDSRSLQKGDLFVALRGERFDGNLFLEEAVQKGSVAFVAEKSIPTSVPHIQVPDALQALIATARELRNSFKGPVIGITGSAGKSSTKEMTAHLIGKDVVKSPASFNNLLGVSKTLCLVEDGTKSLVLEMGMNALREIAVLCETFRPNIGAITNIGDAHLGRLGGREGVFSAKKELFDYLSATAGAKIALNVDDPFVTRAFDEAFAGRKPEILRYSGTGKSADITITSHNIDPDTALLNVELRIEGTSRCVQVPIFGLHHATNMAAAIALARLAGETEAAIFPRLQSLHPASRRGEIHGLRENRTLIDESYNSSPAALKSSLRSLQSVRADRRRVLVLGEMREMDDFSEEVHREVGDAIVALHREQPVPLVLIGVGSATAPLVQTVERLVSSAQTRLCVNSDEASELALGITRPGDLIYVKGSRGVRLDKAVDRILERWRE